MTDEVTIQKPKRIVERSIKYPYYDLKESINFAEKIKNIGGRKEAPVSSILKEMNVKDVTNKRYSYSVSSAEQFGLIERTEEGLKVSDRVMMILFPTEGETQRNAVLKECFKQPPFYQLIISQYDGLQLPEITTLRNTFLHHKIAENVVDQAVNSFIESAKYASVLRDNNLKVNVPDDEKSIAQKTESQSLPELTPVGSKAANPEPTTTDIKASHKFELATSTGEKAVVILPLNYKKEDIEKLKRLLDVFTTDT